MIQMNNLTLYFASYIAVGAFLCLVYIDDDSYNGSKKKKRELISILFLWLFRIIYYSVKKR